jgi:REP element-mobilizing transposase RayT
MARLSRLKYSNPEEGYYHVISRTVLQHYLLGETEKEFFQKLLKKLSQVYFVRVATFAVLSNHFHLICQMMPSDQVGDDDLRRRFDLYYNEDVPKKRQRVLFEEEYDRYRKRWSDLSCFVQDLKQRFTRWYNRKNKIFGHVWAERFKSVLLGDTRALLACMVYVELNAVRAGLVSSPEDYRFCGLHHWVAGGRISKWLDHGSLANALPSVSEEPDYTAKDLILRYLQVIYVEGMEESYGKACISEGDGDSSLETEVYSRRSLGEDGFCDLGVLSFTRRIRYFSDGVMLGSKSFCEEKFNEFRSYFQTRRERTGKLITKKHKKKKVSTPEGNLLHLHSIRSFTRLDQ